MTGWDVDADSFRSFAGWWQANKNERSNMLTITRINQSADEGLFLADATDSGFVGTWSVAFISIYVIIICI
jgi:hypothetical protein